jgi:hypothetical protein
MSNIGQFGVKYRSVWCQISVSVVSNISQCGVKYRSVWCQISVSVVSNIGQCAEGQKDITTSIIASMIGQAAVLVIMYVETFQTDVIVLMCNFKMSMTPHWPIFDITLTDIWHHYQRTEKYRSVWCQISVSVVSNIGQCGVKYRSVWCQISVSVMSNIGQCDVKYRSVWCHTHFKVSMIYHYNLTFN